MIYSVLLGRGTDYLKDLENEMKGLNPKKHKATCLKNRKKRKRKGKKPHRK